MLKISESLFDIPMAQQSRPENVKRLTQIILQNYRAQKASAEASSKAESDAANEKIEAENS